MTYRKKEHPKIIGPKIEGYLTQGNLNIKYLDDQDITEKSFLNFSKKNLEVIQEKSLREDKGMQQKLSARNIFKTRSVDTDNKSMKKAKTLGMTSNEKGKKLGLRKISTLRKKFTRNVSSIGRFAEPCIKRKGTSSMEMAPPIQEELLEESCEEFGEVGEFEDFEDWESFDDLSALAWVVDEEVEEFRLPQGRKATFGEVARFRRNQFLKIWKQTYQRKLEELEEFEEVG
jgi:hypothetical protein